MIFMGKGYITGTRGVACTRHDEWFVGVASWDSPGRDVGSSLDGECASAITVTVMVEEAGNREMICYWNFPKTANFLARYRWR